MLNTDVREIFTFANATVEGIETWICRHCDMVFIVKIRTFGVHRSFKFSAFLLLLGKLPTSWFLERDNHVEVQYMTAIKTEVQSTETISIAATRACFSGKYAIFQISRLNIIQSVVSLIPDLKWTSTEYRVLRTTLRWIHNPIDWFHFYRFRLSTFSVQGM
jgi:hypothetical protein